MFFFIYLKVIKFLNLYDMSICRCLHIFEMFYNFRPFCWKSNIESYLLPLFLFGLGTHCLDKDVSRRPCPLLLWRPPSIVGPASFQTSSGVAYPNFVFSQESHSEFSVKFRVLLKFQLFKSKVKRAFFSNQWEALWIAAIVASAVVIG